VPAEILIKGPIDLAHPTGTDIVQDLVSARENGPRGDNAGWRLECFGEGGSMITGGTQRRRTITAEPGGIGVVRMTGWALVGQATSPSLAWLQINRGIGGKSNVACLRRFEPPTFGSGVQLLGRIREDLFDCI
jgi:hypothetical protein